MSYAIYFHRHLAMYCDAFTEFTHRFMYMSFCISVKHSAESCCITV